MLCFKIFTLFLYIHKLRLILHCYCYSVILYYLLIIYTEIRYCSGISQTVLSSPVSSRFFRIFSKFSRKTRPENFSLVPGTQTSTVQKNGLIISSKFKHSFYRLLIFHTFPLFLFKSSRLLRPLYGV